MILATTDWAGLGIFVTALAGGVVTILTAIAKLKTAVNGAQVKWREDYQAQFARILELAKKTEFAAGVAANKAAQAAGSAATSAAVAVDAAAEQKAAEKAAEKAEGA